MKMFYMDAETKWLGALIIVGIIIFAVCAFVTWCVLKASSNADIRAEMMREEETIRSESDDVD